MVIWENGGSIVEVIVVLDCNEWVPHFAGINPLFQEIGFEVRNSFETKRTLLVNKIRSVTGRLQVDVTFLFHSKYHRCK